MEEENGSDLNIRIQRNFNTPEERKKRNKAEEMNDGGELLFAKIKSVEQPQDILMRKMIFQSNTIQNDEEEEKEEDDEKESGEFDDLMSFQLPSEMQSYKVN